MMIFNLLKPFAEKLKYWDKNKEKDVRYQKDSSKKKPGKQRLLTIMEEFILTLVRLRLGLLSRHLSDIFGVSEGLVSKVFITWKDFEPEVVLPRKSVRQMVQEYEDNVIAPPISFRYDDIILPPVGFGDEERLPIPPK
ncbi:hypothetical protein AWC38_SpisGene10460 [Stylophora pistillata]|uniref:Transposase Helix-turn-helix domain-containing protein n=1 Tax=Stylophora pistillata TaxID=50429 RepID=A0A2B4S4U9_STYPI|nr:hypothetical protein AWC38_SpisGene10460 [Stylophora pistillata]